MPYVQSKLLASTVSTSSRSLTLNSPVTLHNSLIAIVSTFNVATVNVTDNLGNAAWTQIGNFTAGHNGNNILSAWWIFDSLAGTPTVTVNNPAPGNGNITFAVLEYSQLVQNVADSFVGAISGGGSTSPAPGAITLSGAQGLVLAAFCEGNVDLASASVGSGFSVRESSLVGVATEALVVADKFSLTSESPVFTTNASSVWAAIGFSFQANLSRLIVLDHLEGGLM